MKYRKSEMIHKQNVELMEFCLEGTKEYHLPSGDPARFPRATFYDH